MKTPKLTAEELKLFRIDLGDLGLDDYLDMYHKGSIDSFIVALRDIGIEYIIIKDFSRGYVDVWAKEIK